MVGFLEGVFASGPGCFPGIERGERSSGASEGSADLPNEYRGGIAAVQHHCTVTHGSAFEELSLRDKHLVLSLLSLRFAMIASMPLMVGI
jgi:hypothetical protein